MSFARRITELIAVAFGRFGRPLGASLDVVNVVDLIHEQTFGFHDNGDRLQRSHVLEPHRHRPGNRFAHHHVDLGLSREETQDLPDIVTLKLTHAHPATFCDRVRRGGSCLRNRWVFDRSRRRLYRDDAGRRLRRHRRRLHKLRGREFRTARRRAAANSRSRDGSFCGL